MGRADEAQIRKRLNSAETSQLRCRFISPKGSSPKKITEGGGFGKQWKMKGLFSVQQCPSAPRLRGRNFCLWKNRRSVVKRCQSGPELIRNGSEASCRENRYQGNRSATWVD